MASLIQRFFKFIQSNAHALLSKFEDPVKLAEQSVRDLKQNYDESLKGLAEIKAIAITTRRNLEDRKQIAADYERKALMLLQNAQSGKISQEEADRLASEALNKKNNAIKEITKLSADLQMYEANTQKMESKIADLKTQINHWESELTTMKARYKIAKSTKKINQQLSSIGSESTTAMLEDMKTKIQEEEALASAYDEMTYLESDIDKEIDKAIGTTYSDDVQGALAELKMKMLTDKTSSSNGESTDAGKDSTADLKKELDN
ncbi:PspA/IM30 family protein [bacterium]|nr:PspA/IM30 family protein [bacterium]